MYRSRVEEMFQEFRLYNPNDDVERYSQTGPFELSVELKNGRILRYDALIQGTRSVDPHYDEKVIEDESYFRRSFARNLRRLMRDKNLNRESLAKRSNVSYYGICNYLNAKTTPTFFVVNKLAKTLDCDPSDLIRP